jgi:hypothetical protein
MANGMPWVSWGLLAAVTTLGGLSGLYVAITPVADQTPLVARTWEQFASQEAEVASIVARLLVVLGLLGASFGVLGAIVSVLAYRHGRRWASYCLWLVPVTYAAISARMLADDYPVGHFYAALAVAAAAALLVPLLPRPPHDGRHRAVRKVHAAGDPG